MKQDTVSEVQVPVDVLNNNYKCLQQRLIKNFGEQREVVVRKKWKYGVK